MANLALNGPEYRDRDPDALSEIEVDETAQAQFMGRWKIRDYSKSKNVSLIGDLPIFVGHDSADVWAHRIISLDERNTTGSRRLHRITSAKRPNGAPFCTTGMHRKN